MSELAKNYDPAAVESARYAWWESTGVFHEEPDPARPPFIVCMPPPNVTGRAHLGHGSTYTPMDVLTRYHRMLGDNADWLPGLDHAAIATESVLIKELKTEGTSREDLGRPAYIERAWDWSRTYGGTINQQFRTMGFGPDWQRERFTMDDGLSAAVAKVFVQLYREGLIYRGKRLVNWDPKAQTTVSDAEVDHVERDAHLWRIRYPLAASPQSSDGIVVATTRPETMLGDVAIAVHPEDERYAHLIGSDVLVPPLLERRIPIIADASVEREFGTGAVKVTPAHDPTDYEIGLRHALPMPSIMDVQARISGAEVAVGRYAGMDRFVARAAILDDLRSNGLLVAEEAYRHAVSVSERSGEIIEPLLSLQWFVSMKPLAEPALRAYHDGRLTFVPERYGKTYEQWLTNIRDWNISRQVWWGHQLPVWYTPDGDIVVAHTQEEAEQIAADAHGGVALRRDPDTLDTWFSSGIWPFSILGWPEKTEELNCWYPSSVLITGWEIIFLWVARMVMLGEHFIGKIPFGTVFIAPLVFDAQGRKMSKSLGNAIDPMDLVAKYGADAFRMGVLRQMRLEAQELRFQESRCEEARNFNNKIWNATRFALSLAEGLPQASTLPPREQKTLADRWILSRLHAVVAEVATCFESFDFGNAADAIWRFVWYELCDWYVEATKVPQAQTTRAAVLSFALNTAMRVLHPIEPFISEEVWQALPHDGKTIVTASWPDLQEIPQDSEAEMRFATVQTVVERLRNLRAEMGLKDRDVLELAIPENLPEDDAALIARYTNGRMAAVAAVGQTWEETVSAVFGRAPRELMLARLRKDRERLLAEVERGEKKLANESFVARAAAEVVAAEREKLATYRDELASTVATLAEIGEPE